jgi:SAM-dependent methyltransferase
LTDPAPLGEQYRTAENLDVRVSLHQRFSTNRYGWHRWVFDQLDLPASGRAVLEIGCGPGHLWRQNRDRLPSGAAIVLADLSRGMLSEARRYLGLDGPFTYAGADAQRLPFDQARFDLVIANHLLYHVPDREGALAEIRRVLRPGGRLAAATNGTDNLRELSAIGHRVAPDWPGWSAVTETFTLENGAAQLAAHFGQVTLRRYPDSLLVTEAALLVDYLRSGVARAFLSEERKAALAVFVEAELAAHGAIPITKDTGLFLAE